MRIVATVSIDGQEVGRQVARLTDLQTVVVTMLQQATNLQREAKTNEIEEFSPIAISVTEYAPDAKATAPKKV